MPVVQHPYHNVGHVQGVPERQRVIYPVRANCPALIHSQLNHPL